MGHYHSDVLLPTIYTQSRLYQDVFCKIYIVNHSAEGEVIFQAPFSSPFTACALYQFTDRGFHPSYLGFCLFLLFQALKQGQILVMVPVSLDCLPQPLT